MPSRGHRADLCPGHFSSTSSTSSDSRWIGIRSDHTDNAEVTSVAIGRLLGARNMKMLGQTGVRRHHEFKAFVGYRGHISPLGRWGPVIQLFRQVE